MTIKVVRARTHGRWSSRYHAASAAGAEGDGRNQNRPGDRSNLGDLDISEARARDLRHRHRPTQRYKGFLVNRFVGVCIGCGNNVEPGAGVIQKDQANDRWLVKCLACVDGKPKEPELEPPGQPDAARFAGLDFGNYEDKADIAQVANVVKAPA